MSDNPVRALLDAIGVFRAGNPIEQEYTVDRMNKIVQALRFALNISGPDVLIDGDGIHIRRTPFEFDIFRGLLIGAPRMKVDAFAPAGANWQWEYPWQEAMSHPGGGKFDVVKPGGRSSSSGSDIYAYAAINGLENGNRTKNNVAGDQIGIIGPGVNQDGYASGNSYPAGFQPRPIAPNLGTDPTYGTVAVSVPIFAWQSGPKIAYRIYVPNAHDGTCT